MASDCTSTALSCTPSNSFLCGVIYYLPGYDLSMFILPRLPLVLRYIKYHSSSAVHMTPHQDCVQIIVLDSSPLPLFFLQVWVGGSGDVY